MISAAKCSMRLPRAVSGSRLGQIAARRVEEQRRWIRTLPRSQRPSAPKSQSRRNDRDNKQELNVIGEENRRKQDPGGQNQHQQTQSQSEQRPDPQQQQQPGLNTQLATTLAQSDSSDLVTEVCMPDDPDGVLPPEHPALALLGNSSLVIQRQIEMMNIMVGFEQANRYIIMDGQGQTIGYIAEQDHGIGSTMTRQLFKTHRSFTTHIFDRREREVLRIHRPFSYISSRIRVYDPVPAGGYHAMETSIALQGTSASSAMNQGAVTQISPLKLEEMRIIGEAQQHWAPLRRKYNLFSYRPAPENNSTLRIESGDKPTSDTMALTEPKTPDRAIEAGMIQFAHVNEPFMSWDFNLRDELQNTVGSVNRNFGGFAREIFTDTGVYVLRMDSAAVAQTAQFGGAGTMTRDQRAVMLATAVCIDFDYFSRHSGSGGSMIPLWIPWGGGAAAEGGAAAGTIEGAAGAGAVEGAAGAASRGMAGGVASEGALAGASSMAGAGGVAGYEAMQRGAYGGGGGGGGQQPGIPPQEQVVDDATSQTSEPFFDPDETGFPEQDLGQPQQHEESWWNSDEDPWGKGGGGGNGPPSAGDEGGGGGEGGGGLLDAISDFFGD